jgi:hypothetical protein
MSRTHHHRKFRIHGERLEKPNARRISRALQAWAEAKREAEAEAEDQRKTGTRTSRPPKRRAS